MKLYAPRYYQKFKCIADRCEHSCCIGWEIDVDPETLKKYQRLTGDYASVIRASICMEETPHFKLCACDRCPHLDERGLCRIILNVGEDYLCDICREHPRFYNFTSVAEVGLGMSCPEAARLILSSPDYAEMDAVGEVDAAPDGIAFDGRALRKKLYSILQRTDISYTDRLARIYRDHAINPFEDAYWLELLDGLEYLDNRHRDLFANYSAAHRPHGTDEYSERFLAYLIYRHCTEAVDTDDCRARLAFCLFCERLLASLIYTQQAVTLEAVASLASTVSEELEYSEDNTCALMG